MDIIAFPVYVLSFLIFISHAYTHNHAGVHMTPLLHSFVRRMICPWRRRRFTSLSHMYLYISIYGAHLSTAVLLLTTACEELASAWRGAKSIVTAKSIIIVVMKTRMERVPRPASAAACLPCCTCMAFSRGRLSTFSSLPSLSHALSRTCVSTVSVRQKEAVYAHTTQYRSGSTVDTSLTRSLRSIATCACVQLRHRFF